MSVSSSSSSLPPEPRQTVGKKASRANQERVRRRAYTTHRHTIGSFREGSRPAQPPWCIIRWQQHNADAEQRVLCFGDGLAVNLLRLEEESDEWTKQEQPFVNSKAATFPVFASVDLSDKLASDRKIFAISPCPSILNSVLIAVQSVASPMLVDLRHKVVKCTFEAPKNSGELVCITTSDSNIFATGHDSGKVLLWNLSDADGRLQDVPEKHSNDGSTNNGRSAAPVMITSYLDKPVVAMSWNNDHLAVATKTGELLVNLIVEGYRCELLRKFSAVEYGEPLFVTWCSKTTVISGGEDDIITMHSLETKKEHRETQLQGHSSYVTDAVSDEKHAFNVVTCSLDGRLIAWTNGSKKVLVHEIGESFYRLQAAGSALYTLSVDSNGKWSLNRYVVSPKYRGR
eukprot:Plantae.Rhodophyta-Purpureofilum_apyrenoidigerum.ctg12551.p1 GENE.Plantae.Rhodophyta-Purpureofilum_apyrenoidigerum.ctg12551~~Plantae.Rhodophyta-Purpureofilum_apyrenoidigerum.ctg12551.p1  ORF type:complete len:400 (-),score=51.31 Plantae.Rhodophyta-Purpureofilum_apyrenoidigerum.ctg12551:64-1263(-)